MSVLVEIFYNSSVYKISKFIFKWKIDMLYDLLFKKYASYN